MLERAAETGSAQASFMLAETYDPIILSTWGTYGTRGEAAKARELYAKAHAGGIQEAKDRFDALTSVKDDFIFRSGPCRKRRPVKSELKQEEFSDEYAFRSRLLLVLAMLAPVMLALQLAEIGAQAQSARPPRSASPNETQKDE